MKLMEKSWAKAVAWGLVAVTAAGAAVCAGLGWSISQYSQVYYEDKVNDLTQHYLEDATAAFYDDIRSDGTLLEHKCGRRTGRPWRRR